MISHFFFSSQLSFLPCSQCRMVSELGGCLRLRLLLARHEPCTSVVSASSLCLPLCSATTLFLSLRATFSWPPGNDRPYLLLEPVHRCASHCCFQLAQKAVTKGCGCRGNECVLTAGLPGAEVLSGGSQGSWN